MILDNELYYQENYETYSQPSIMQNALLYVSFAAVASSVSVVAVKKYNKKLLSMATKENEAKTNELKTLQAEVKKSQDVYPVLQSEMSNKEGKDIKNPELIEWQKKVKQATEDLVKQKKDMEGIEIAIEKAKNDLITAEGDERTTKEEKDRIIDVLTNKLDGLELQKTEKEQEVEDLTFVYNAIEQQLTDLKNSIYFIFSPEVMNVISKMDHGAKVKFIENCSEAEAIELNNKVLKLINFKSSPNMTPVNLGKFFNVNKNSLKAFLNMNTEGINTGREKAFMDMFADTATLGRFLDALKTDYAATRLTAWIGDAAGTGLHVKSMAAMIGKITDADWTAMMNNLPKHNLFTQIAKLTRDFEDTMADFLKIISTTPTSLTEFFSISNPKNFNAFLSLNPTYVAAIAKKLNAEGIKKINNATAGTLTDILLFGGDDPAVDPGLRALTTFSSPKFDSTVMTAYLGLTKAQRVNMLTAINTDAIVAKRFRDLDNTAAYKAFFEKLKTVGAFATKGEAAIELTKLAGVDNLFPKLSATSIGNLAATCTAAGNVTPITKLVGKAAASMNALYNKMDIPCMELFMDNANTDKRNVILGADVAKITAFAGLSTAKLESVLTGMDKDDLTNLFARNANNIKAFVTWINANALSATFYVNLKNVLSGTAVGGQIWNNDKKTNITTKVNNTLNACNI